LEQKKCGSGCVEWKGFKDDILSKFRRCVNGMDEECECGRYVAVKSDIGNSRKSGREGAVQIIYYKDMNKITEYCLITLIIILNFTLAWGLFWFLAKKAGLI